MSLLRIAGVALILVFLAVPGIRADGLPVFGYLEKVRVGPTDLVMRGETGYRRRHLFAGL